MVGAGRKKADSAAWTALEEKKELLDLPRLMAALRTTSAAEAAQRDKVLGKRDDPRLFSELLGLLEDPPWRANVFKDFVRAAIDVLHQTGDVRVREAWLDLAPRYKSIIETSVGDWVGTQLTRAARALEGLAPKPLSAADQQRLSIQAYGLGRDELAGFLAVSPTLTKLSVHGSLNWLTLEVALELLAGTKVKELHVFREDFEFSISGDVLEVRHASESSEKVLAGGLRRGRVKSVRPAPERFFGGDPLRWIDVAEADVAFAKRCQALIS